jgi:DMSO/TMAO reductase YedYZ molybdopterin-dependent catalytic subunit
MLHGVDKGVESVPHGRGAPAQVEQHLAAAIRPSTMRMKPEVLLCWEMNTARRLNPPHGAPLSVLHRPGMVWGVER